MTINTINSPQNNTTIMPNAISPTNTETKNIQNQITSKTQSLNRLSSDSEMTISK